MKMKTIQQWTGGVEEIHSVGTINNVETPIRRLCVDLCALQFFYDYDFYDYERLNLHNWKYVT